ncbi:hypothetical protein SAMN05216189_105620 [Pseudomonas delhiensis]|uniref:Uncharacterized protein n=2 Tax=Pseudomonas delhiensis TaxID=366289 RepID=A0A239N3W6_9PSED|nr:hypothetical protein SAMN05216189_105620 [Pseudomonas delhiensis]SNT49440.1 hypothetical protein SAMN06295949_13623 [Pseudomonas delhiensis]
MGRGPQGLLGEGELPWPEVVAARAFPSQINIGGEYATDDLSGAAFLISELENPDNEMSAEETEDSIALLILLFARLKQSAKVSASELESLRKRAEAIPYIGSPLFGHANLPGTLAGVAGVLHARLLSKRLIDLLDIPDKLKKELLNWAKNRGQSGSRSARKTFHRRIKLVYKKGHLLFEIPATETAKLYRIAGKTGAEFVHVPAYNSMQALRSRTPIDGTAYGSRGVGKLLTGTASNGLLAFGPQAIIDAYGSSSWDDFMHRSAYSQPTNAAAFVVGTLAATAIGGTAIVGILIGLSIGVAVQIIMSDDMTGWGRDIGDSLTGKN